MSSDEFVSDFQAFPTVGSIPLAVGIAMRKKKESARIVCDFGDGTQSEEGLVINHTYSGEGTFTGRVMVFEGKLDKEPKQQITFTVTAGRAQQRNLIGTVGLNHNKAIAYTNKSTQFIMTHPSISTPGAFDEISWDFGDGSTLRPAKKSSDAVHTYAKDGNYSVTVTVGRRRFDPAKKQTVMETESASCSVMVLPEGYH